LQPRSRVQACTCKGVPSSEPEGPRPDPSRAQDETQIEHACVDAWRGWAAQPPAAITSIAVSSAAIHGLLLYLTGALILFTFFCLRGGPLVIIYFWMPAGDEDISR
jgi:hypothetical protein